jgi:hypothetical protein
MIAAVIAGAAFILTGYKPIGKGLILGTLFSVLNFVLMGQSLPLRVSSSGRRRFILALGALIFRYALLAVPLILAVRSEQFHLPATIGGIFMIQLVIIAEHFYGAIRSRGKNPGLG